jgi:hypothetical protein
MSLFVVYLPDTGHVVGAMNATGAALSPEVDALVGSALPVRVSTSDEVVKIPLPSRELALLRADDEPRVFADPLAFGVEQVPDEDPKPTLVRLAEWSTELTIDEVGLVVTLPDNANQRTPVVAVVSDGQDPRVLSSAIEAGSNSVRLPLTVPRGGYGALVLASGWRGRLEEVTAR